MAMIYAAVATRSNYVVESRVVGIERRQKPGGVRSNYVFSIEVQWSNSKRFQIYRQYSDFFTLQQRLSSLFPNIASNLPQVPALYIQRIFGLLNESVHESRLSLIDSFCQAILKLHDEVSHSRCVSDFFSPQPGDDRLKSLDPTQRVTVTTPHPRGAELPERKVKVAFKRENDEQLDLNEGDYVVVIREDSSGWACVGKPDFKSKSGKIGWVPADFLLPVSRLDESCIDHSAEYARFVQSMFSTVKGKADVLDDDDYYNVYLEQYLAVASYNAEDPSQLMFSSGAKLSVIDKEEDGWWLATCGGKHGWVPSTFLVRLEAGPEQQESLASPESFVVTEDHDAELEDEMSVPEGAEVHVTVKKLSGWWQVRYEGRSGLVPASKLKPKDPDNPAHSLYINVHREKTFKAPPRRHTVKTGNQRVTMADRPPASLPHEHRLTSKLSTQHEASLSGSYDEPRQWTVPIHHQCSVVSPKSTANRRKMVDKQTLVSAGNGDTVLKIPAVPCSNPPSAADYAELTSRSVPSGGYAEVRATTLPSVVSPENGEPFKEPRDRRCQTLTLTQGQKSCASLGISWAHGVADTGRDKGGGKQNGGSSQSSVVSEPTTSGGRSPHSSSADSSPTLMRKSPATRTLPQSEVVLRSKPASASKAVTSLSAVRASFIDVSEMPDSDKPRYTKKDLWRVLEEKNELKLRVYELEEELEQLKSVLRGRLVDHEMQARTPTVENAETPVAGPVISVATTDHNQTESN